MSGLFDVYHNKLNMAKKAARFRQFTFKLMQIRAAEQWAKLSRPKQHPSRPVLPRDIVIRVTEKCFLKCKFCAQGGESGRVDRKNIRSGPVTPETFQKIIDETAKWPIKPFIKLTGGEPLVLGDSLLDAVKEMRQRGFVVKLNTNGMLLKSRKYARKIAEADLNYLSISLDGGKDIHNEIRGNSRLFDAMMEGIDNVQRYAGELGKKNLMILMSMMVSSETQDQIETVYKIACDKRIDWFNIQYLNYTTPETCDQADRFARDHFGTRETPWQAFCNPRFNDIKPDLVAGQIRRILSLRRPVPVSVMGKLTSASDIDRYYYSSDPLRRNICAIPFTGMHIVPPGKAAFCIDYPFLEYGDIRTDSIESVWFGEQATAFRKALINYYNTHHKNLPQCQRCNWRFN